MSDISTLAFKWVKDNERLIIEKFADPNLYLPVTNPTTYFMAGSPGAGKTEYSKEFIHELETKEPTRKIVRIDTDEVRDFIPFYDKTNASAMQKAAVVGVAQLFDYVQKHGVDALLDATFTPYDVAFNNIKRAIGRKRKIGIIYVYQNPEIAWEFTKIREKLEGRPVPLSYFIASFIEARNNVNKIKKEFGSNVELTVVIKNLDNQGIEKMFFNVDNVDGYLKIIYNKQSLEELLQ